MTDTSRPNPREHFKWTCVSCLLTFVEASMLMLILGGAYTLFKPLELPTGSTDAATSAHICTNSKDVLYDYYLLMSVFFVGLATTLFVTCLTVVQNKLDRESLERPAAVIQVSCNWLFLFTVFASVLRYQGRVPAGSSWLLVPAFALPFLYLIHAFVLKRLSTYREYNTVADPFMAWPDEDCMHSTLALGVLRGVMMLVLLYEVSCQVFRPVDTQPGADGVAVGNRSTSNVTVWCIPDDILHRLFLPPVWAYSAVSFAINFLALFTACWSDSVTTEMFDVSAVLLAVDALAWGVLCAPAYTAMKSHMDGTGAYDYIPRMMFCLAVLGLIERGLVSHLRAAHKTRRLQFLARQHPQPHPHPHPPAYDDDCDDYDCD